MLVNTNVKPAIFVEWILWARFWLYTVSDISLEHTYVIKQVN